MTAHEARELSKNPLPKHALNGVMDFIYARVKERAMQGERHDTWNKYSLAVSDEDRAVIIDALRAKGFTVTEPTMQVRIAW